LIGNLLIKQGEVVGFAIIQIDAAPIELRLINTIRNTVSEIGVTDTVVVIILIRV